jgi:hypothetical protein
MSAELRRPRLAASVTQPGHRPARPSPSGGIGGFAEAFCQGTQDTDELGRVKNLEVEALDSHMKCEFVEGVGSGMEDAGVLAGGFQPAGGGGGVLGDVLEGSVDEDARLVAVGSGTVSGEVPGEVSGTVVVWKAVILCRSRDGSICWSLVRARSEASASPATLPVAAV